MTDGIAADRVAAWLRERVEVSPPISCVVIPGGRSNLTYEIVDSVGRRWVLRRPPLHSLLPSAHDMSREYRIITNLAGHGVPVPATVGYEDDIGVTGAPFYVMNFVPGHVLRDPAHAEAVLAVGARAVLSKSMVDVLIALHQLEPDAVGLGNLGRRDQYLSRQLRTWSTQLQRIRDDGGRQLQVLDEVHERLLDRIPPQQGISIVHGDYRLDNMVVLPNGQVAAVLDWELCTLGDPLADVAILAVYWSDPGDDFAPLGRPATLVPGFWRREEVVETYRKSGELDFSAFDYYLAFANWKLAVILEGVFNRFNSGAYGDTGDQDWRRFDAIVPELADRAIDLL